MRYYELYDKVPQAVLCLKEDDGSLTKVCDVKDVEPVNPTYMPDKDAINDYIHKSQEVYSIKAKINEFDNYLADCCSKTVNSYKVICTTKKFQKRRHHKYRTNKKWAKRYGYTYVEVQDEPIIFMDGTIYCTKEGFDQIKKICKKKDKNI